MGATPAVDSGLACLVMLARFHNVAAAPEQLTHEYAEDGRMFGRAEMLLAAKKLGLKAKSARSSLSRLSHTPLPAIATDSDGRFFIIARLDDGKALIHDPQSQRPEVLSFEELEVRWTGELILIRSEASLAGDLARFDFSWFIPAIVKYRKLLGEVLLVSFVLQIFALLTPLFFQVVMDKVLVHRGLTTLDVIAIGLLGIMIFETLLSGLRSYVFAHTASRIDVELGSRLFRHLVTLPLAYFQARRVGDSVARVRELENIRSFLTGNSVTLILDVLFSVVFIAVMFMYSGWLTLVVILSLPLYFIVSLLITPVLRARLNMLAGRVSQPIMRLAQLWTNFQQTGVSVQRLGDILNTRTELSQDSRSALPPLRGDVEFDQVHFRYRPDGSEVLRGISLTIQAGEVIGVVGRSGSGKSTLTRLLQRLYTPERGRVLVDGMDLALADVSSLRRQIGVVLQDNMLFARSIRENIALVDPGTPIEAVMHAAKMAGAHDFILELPEGYDTVVGEHGASLSGGQRQRIAIARALIGNPRILIFDEATSALDYESERIIQQNMQAICKGRTVIIIAHRLSAVRDANRILVMDRGQIVEQGNHAELLAHQAGHYSRLHRLQQGGAA
jgi:ABC-type bacteriocin/lantibiotic exporter with double-glycine peptidase domain